MNGTEQKESQSRESPLVDREIESAAAGVALLFDSVLTIYILRPVTMQDFLLSNFAMNRITLAGCDCESIKGIQRESGILLYYHCCVKE